MHFYDITALIINHLFTLSAAERSNSRSSFLLKHWLIGLIVCDHVFGCWHHWLITDGLVFISCWCIEQSGQSWLPGDQLIRTLLLIRLCSSSHCAQVQSQKDKVHGGHMWSMSRSFGRWLHVGFKGWSLTFSVASLIIYWKQNQSINLLRKHKWQLRLLCRDAFRAPVFL